MFLIPISSYEYDYFTGDKVGEFLDGATDGAIYISFGSILQGSQMSEDRRQLFLNVFRLNVDYLKMFSQKLIPKHKI